MRSPLATKKSRYDEAAMREVSLAILGGETTAVIAAKQLGFHENTVRKFVRTTRAKLSDADLACLAVKAEMRSKPRGLRAV